MTNNNQTAPVTDEELDQMIWKLERDGMTPKQLSLMRELREVRRAKGEPVAQIEIISGVLVNERWMHSSLPNGWHDLYASRLSGNSEQLEPVSNRDELPPNSFTNEELAGMTHGDNPQANAYRELLAFRRSSPATQNGWIPVSERMPDRDYVLAADISGAYYPPHLPNTQVGIYADWFGDGKPSWDDGDGNDLHLKQVTHWQPLPAAPKEEG